VVGERGPELVNFRGGERVWNNEATGQLVGGPQRITGRLDLGNGLYGFVEGVVETVTDQRDSRAATRTNVLRGVGR
jgi:hypothetical protein